MNMAVCIKENVVRLYVPKYSGIASAYQKEVIDEGEREKEREMGASKLTCG